MTKLLATFLLCFCLTLLFCFIVLPILKKAKAKQEILKYVSQHETKSGTPTMGGIAFLLATLLTCPFVFGQDSTLAYLTLAITIGYGVVGFLDDFIKVFSNGILG